MSNAPRNMVVTRQFDAPVEAVWQAWIDPELVMRWWGPTGFTSPLARMDVREGGTSLVCMRAPAEYGGQDMYNSWTYRTVEPHTLLEFVQHFTDKDGTPFDPATAGLPPGIPYEVRHVITFKQIRENSTELTVTEYGYTADEVVAISRLGMEQCLDKMAAIFSES